MALIVPEKKYQELKQKYSSLLKEFNDLYSSSKEKEAAQKDLLKSTKRDYIARIAQLEAKLQECEEKLSKETITPEAHEEEIAKLQASHLDETSKIRKENAVQIRQTIEYIETRKEELQKKGEKELLIEVIMVLDGYAGRIERLEQNLEYHEIEKKISAMKNEFADHLDKAETELLDKLSEGSRTVNSLIEQKSTELTEKIKETNAALAEHIDTFKLIESLNKQTDLMNELYQLLFVQMTEMKKSILGKLKSYNLNGQFESIKNDLDYIKDTTDNIEVTTDEMCDVIDRIKTDD